MSYPENYLQELTAGEVAPMPESETWEATMERMAAAVAPAEINEKTYFYFIGVLPPRLMADNCFCFAEGAEPFRLFWERNGRYFVRSLDWDQTRILCRRFGAAAY